MKFETLSRELTEKLLANLQSLDASAFGDGCAWTGAEFLSALPNKYQLSVVATKTARLSGFAIASHTNPRYVHIHRLAVDPSQRKQSIGQNLLREVELRAMEGGASTVSLEFARDLNLHRFYQSVGFVQADDDLVTEYLNMKGKQQAASMYTPVSGASRYVYLKNVSIEHHASSPSKAAQQESR
ncbi:MAG: GNAT family N-acetyltransferase [Pirellulales bacterium]|nr:GNAT family N-acetyltransferase [Pirellulales bacterium]